MTDPTDAQTERAHLQREQDSFARGQVKACANTEPHGPHVWGGSKSCLGVSAHPDPLPPPATGDQPIPDAVPGVLYVWQMLNADNVWNIIGMAMPNGVQMPLVTTSFNLAWEAFELAQAHADRHQTRCRLACFSLDSELAIVDPEPPDDNRV